MNYKKLAEERFSQTSSDPYCTMTLKDYEKYYKDQCRWKFRTYMFGDNPKISFLGTGSQLLLLVVGLGLGIAFCVF